MEPLKAPGSAPQSGARTGTVARSASATAMPMNGKRSASSGSRTLTPTLTATAAASTNPVMATRIQSTGARRSGSLTIGAWRCCCRAAGNPKTASAMTAATWACSTAAGATPLIHIIVVVVSPMTLPEPPALEAATMAAR